MRLRALLHQLLALTRANRLDRELDGEVLAHLEMAEHDGIAAGLSPAEARRAARRRFGSIAPMREQHRDRRSVRWIETVIRDVHHGLASLARDPAFAAVAVGVLALGIGANTAMFSLVDAVLLKPLPFPAPNRLVRVWEAPTRTSLNGVAALNFVDWKRLKSVFEALAAKTQVNVATMIDGEPVRVAGQLVSADYFEVFGVKARIGRTFTAHEDQPDAPGVIVLSDAAWRTRFGGDPAILDRDLVLDGERHRVIGVLPPGTFDRERAAFWKPLVFTREQLTRGFHWLTVIGRLRSDVTLEQAQEQMRAVSASLATVQPQWKRDWTVTIEPLDRRLVGDTLRRSIYLAFGAVVMVLLIGCANVSNLLLARGASRSQEMALRAALGASRGRLVAQLLTETLVLCVLGGAAGVIVAYVFIQAADPLLSASLPSTADVGLDLRVLGFAAAVVLGVSLIVGLIPSLQTSAGTLLARLNQATRGSSSAHQRLRRTIVAGEVAVSLVLICGALLLFRSLIKLQQVETGVRVERVITMETDLPSTAYPTPERAAGFFQSIVERLRVVPGIEQAAIATDLPLERIGSGEAIILTDGRGIDVRYKRVDAGYFSTLGIPLLAGRSIGARDRAGAPRVLVVNEELARRLSAAFGRADLVGTVVRLTTPDYVKKEGELLDVQIIGVIRNERVDDVRAPVQAVAYVPVAQVPTRGVKLLVRARTSTSAALPLIRAAVSELDPNLPLANVRTMAQVKEDTLSGARQPTFLIGAFAVVAASLAALGLYGVISHTVTERRREIGIRMALGASGRTVLSHVLRNALSMIMVGLAAGFVGAVVLTRATKSLLFEVSVLDPFAFIAAGVMMMLVGMLAAWVPANRAARADPMSALREG